MQKETCGIAQEECLEAYIMGRAWTELDRKALRHNVAVLRSLLPVGCELMPAVKADAYGHGAVLVGRELNKMGVQAFCVACVEEAVKLRKGGVEGEILILGYTHPALFPLLGQYDLSQTVVDYAYAQDLEKYGEKVAVHIGVDTGMHRLGERCEHIEKLCQICEMKNLVIKGAYTHLCVADSAAEKDRAYTRKQAEAFFHTMEVLKNRGYEIPRLHLLASSGVLCYPELAGDYARVGIALYGACGDIKGWGHGVTVQEEVGREMAGHGVTVQKTAPSRQPGLQPVLALKARVASVRKLQAGESAGYGLDYIARRPARLAVLTIGYGDGLPRALSGGAGQVLIGGRRVAIAGRICMDQTLVDVTDVEGVQPGDVAVLIGSQQGEHITVEEMARRAGTIPNEILSRLGERLGRRWADEKMDKG